MINFHIQADGERLRLEREAMEGFVSPESHSNLKKQLMDMKATIKIQPFQPHLTLQLCTIIKAPHQPHLKNAPRKTLHHNYDKYNTGSPA